MARPKNPVFVRRLGRKRGRVRVGMMVYVTYIAVTMTAALVGLAVNRHIEQGETHAKWLAGQTAGP